MYQMLVQSQWQTKKLGDICEMAPGGTPLKSIKEYWLDGKVSWYSSGELNELYTSAPRKCITHKGLDNSNTKLFPKGSLLIGIYDTAALKMSILDRQAAFNQAIVGIKPNSQIEVKFIFHIINAMKTEILSQRRGVRQKNLSFEKIKNIRLPLPPLPEQHRIVSILDEAFTEIDKAKVITEKNLKNAKEVLEGKFESIFSNVSKDWTIKRLEEITNIEYGYTEKAKDKGDYRYIRITDIDKEGNLEPENKMFIEYSKEAEKFVLEDGDLLMARTGATFGKVLLYRDIEKSVFASYLIKISFKENILNKLYWYFSKSRIYWRQASNLSSGAAQPQFNGSALREIIFSFPSSLTDQHRIIAELDAISEETKKLEKLYRSKLTHLEELKKSILKQAFEGKL